MIHLKAGQNTALTADTVRFTAQTAGTIELGALVVGTDLRARDEHDHVCASRPATAGVSHTGGAVDVALSQVRADAHAVLLFVTAGQVLGTVTATLSQHGTPTAEFVITPAAGESALICFEVYRRDGGWKLRALGQGYAGGAAQLLPAHGVPAPAPAQSTAPTETLERPASAPGVPLEVEHGLQRMWMIFEDAARSAAALVSAREYATTRLDQELSEAVSNPATRNTPAADAARTAAQRRHDELVALADADHRRDSDQLGREIAEADSVMPASLASWLAPAWTTKAVRSDGIRLGELYALDRGALRVPYCVPVPLNRPLWVDTESSAAAALVVGALVARLVAALPDKPTRVDLIDLTGGLRGLAAPLAPLLAGPLIADHAEIGARLGELAHAAELAEIAYNSGQAVPPSEHRILVAADFPHGYQPADVVRLGQLMVRGDLIGLSLVIVGSGSADAGDGPVALLSQSCRHLPTLPGTPLFDPWTGNAWELDLDMLPAEPELQARYLRI
ncbi:TerD family protein [Nocardia asteroides]|uniref:TerD family protein n=1 Tax=Nocardia asteroides TaxID=1824 RepID=UPI003666C36D